MLTDVQNGMGMETQLTYGYSAPHFLRDKVSAQPWITSMPSHQTVVDQIDIIDHIGKTKATSQYAYHDGSFDSLEREFRGFGLVDQYDAQVHQVGKEDEAIHHTDPVCVRTWYHNGAAGWEPKRNSVYYKGDKESYLLPGHEMEGLGTWSPADFEDAFRALAGQIVRTEVYAVDKSGERRKHPYQITQNRYLVRRIQSEIKPDSGLSSTRSVFATFNRESINFQYEETPADPMVAHEFLLEIDRFGVPIRSASVGYPRRKSEVRQQKKLHAQTNYSRVAHFDLPGRYEIGIPLEEKAYKLEGLETENGSSYFSMGNLESEIVLSLKGEVPFYLPFTDGHQSHLLQWDQIYYWNDSQEKSLRFGEIGDMPLVHHTESACFDDAFIQHALGEKHSKEVSSEEGRYEYRNGYWWQPSETVFYGPGSTFFLARSTKNLNDVEVRLKYDTEYHLNIIGIETWLPGESGPRFIVSSIIDYNLLAPWQITDPNGNTSEVQYDPFGVIRVSTVYGEILDESSAVQKSGHKPLSEYSGRFPSNIESLLKHPERYVQQAGSYFYYELDSWEKHKKPLTAVALTRENWVYDGQGGNNEASRHQVNVEYSDGFGRTLQSKTLVEPGEAISLSQTGEIKTVDTGDAPRWQVSGHVVFDNKQQPIQQYEPYFSITWEYEPEEKLNTYGVATRIEYDALGRERKTHFPDGSLAYVEIEPWITRQYDPNDAVVGSEYENRVLDTYSPNTPERVALAKAKIHNNTPVITYLDPLGRPIITEQANENQELRREQAILDSAGNPHQLLDARGITAFTYTRDLLGRTWKEESVDAGTKWEFVDALDMPLLNWDGNDTQKQTVFDAIGRVQHVHVQTADGMDQVTERYFYGDAPEVLKAELHNSKGQIIKLFDQAGIIEANRYDILGNSISYTRQIASDYKSIPDWTNSGAGVTLEDGLYQSIYRYDALGRPLVQSLPDKTTRHFDYHQNGALKQLRLFSSDGKTSNQSILSGTEYNARGQRTKALLGNGIIQTFTYDPTTFRLKNMRSVLPGKSGTSTPKLFQDLHYYYDPVGNITRIEDGAQSPNEERGIIRNLKVGSEKEYTYDAFYQLTEATGRTHLALSPYDHQKPDVPGLMKGTRHLSLNNGQAIRRFRRTYRYDLNGNRSNMTHTVIGIGKEANQQWQRNYWIAEDSNRSLPLNDPNGNPLTKQNEKFDANGNCLYLGHIRNLQWDYRNLLAQALIIEREGGQENDTEYYTYGADHMRVRKVNVRQLGNGSIESIEKIYLDGCEIKKIKRNEETILLRTTSHLADDNGSIAKLHHWEIDKANRETSSIANKKYHYQLSDHLGSISMEVNQKGETISYEEFDPFGGSTFITGDNAKEINLKEYRYSGKEKDDVTGLYYYGYRYYASWLSRWMSSDPIGPEDGLNIYCFVRNNPIVNKDNYGLQSSSNPPIRAIIVDFVILEADNLEVLGENRDRGLSIFGLNDGHQRQIAQKDFLNYVLSYENSRPRVGIYDPENEILSRDIVKGARALESENGKEGDSFSLEFYFNGNNEYLPKGTVESLVSNDHFGENVGKGNKKSSTGNSVDRVGDGVSSNSSEGEKDGESSTGGGNGASSNSSEGEKVGESSRGEENGGGHKSPPKDQSLIPQTGTRNQRALLNGDPNSDVLPPYWITDENNLVSAVTVPAHNDGLEWWQSALIVIGTIAVAIAVTVLTAGIGTAVLGTSLAATWTVGTFAGAASAAAASIYSQGLTSYAHSGQFSIDGEQVLQDTIVGALTGFITAGTASWISGSTKGNFASLTGIADNALPLTNVYKTASNSIRGAAISGSTDVAVEAGRQAIFDDKINVGKILENGLIGAFFGGAFDSVTSLKLRKGIKPMVNNKLNTTIDNLEGPVPEPMKELHKVAGALYDMGIIGDERGITLALTNGVTESADGIASKTVLTASNKTSHNNIKNLVEEGVLQLPNGIGMHEWLDNVNNHAERQGIMTLIHMGFADYGWTATTNLGCFGCQNFIEKFAPQFMHLDPKPNMALYEELSSKVNGLFGMKVKFQIARRISAEYKFFFGGN